MAAGDVDIRPVTISDAAAIHAIYAPVVESTHISFELVAPSVEEMARRVEETTSHFPWFVAVDAGEVVGYAYAASHSSRAAYRWAVDTSVYLDEDARGRGVGTLLYRSLLDRLRELGYVSAYAGIALPNAASIALHERLGFVPVGSFPVAGFKLGRWIDVGLWHCPLSPPPDEPVPPEPAQ